MQRVVLIPLIVACALFMENMDSTVITTSLPAIAADIGESPLALKLALTSYLVSLAVFIPISGWIADRHGSRSVFAAAIVVFVGGSLLCAGSNSLEAFVVSRFLQGIGGAMMVPVGRLVLMRAVPKRDYVAALNYLTIPALLGPVIGPALGGAITLFFNWRWIFIINVPIGVLGLFLVLRHIPNAREANIPDFDLRGFALSGTGLSVLMLGFSALGGHLLPATVALACIVVGIAILAAYARHARRVLHPVIDLRLMRLATFRHGVLVGSLFRAGLGATPFLLPLLLQLGFGLNPLQSGTLTCATAVGAMFMKTTTVRILKRWGFRNVLSLNGVAASAIVVAFGLFSAATSHLVIATVLLLSGCLRSLQFTALNAISFADIAPERMSQASSLSSMAQRLSQSMGIAIGAYLLQLSSSLQGHATIAAADFWPAFVGIGLISVVAPLLHRRLPPDAGAEVSGHARIEAARRP
ncbi:MAG TPA: MFS transporter [Casimicrobiaceae bacterium]|nr:MFS transporter [Casimicrobiaceae bacterium]